MLMAVMGGQAQAPAGHGRRRGGRHWGHLRGPGISAEGSEDG